MLSIFEASMEDLANKLNGSHFSDSGKPFYVLILWTLLTPFAALHTSTRSRSRNLN